MKILLAALAVILIMLQLQLWLAPDSLLRERSQLRAQLEQQRRLNQELSESNQRLYAELRDLADDLSAVEGQARRELGMVRRGETFYWIVDER